jgi:hypothetical protein
MVETHLGFVGPTQVARITLVTSVDVTDARKTDVGTWEPRHYKTSGGGIKSPFRVGPTLTRWLVLFEDSIRNREGSL